jgi:cobalt-zinc-cadmium efflux system membrane fusion protein
LKFNSLAFHLMIMISATAISSEKSDSAGALAAQPVMEGSQLIIPAATARSMQLSTAGTSAPKQARTIRLTGQLILDRARLVHVTTRFGGEVVRVASADGDDGPAIRIGQKVKKGQLLAILWSKEIGEKKSDMVDALSQLYLDESTYKHLKSLEKSGAVPERAIEEMQRKYESDLISVERIRRTLRSWRIADSEMQKIESEARRIHARATAPPSENPEAPSTETPLAGAIDSSVDATWAEIQIVAPMNGTILEKNLTVGDIVDTNDDLFKIADLSQLVVMAHIYEEDLPNVLSLPADQRKWRIDVSTHIASKSVEGRINVVGDVIDPNQHTAILQGPIDNTGGEFRVGQYVQTVFDVPPQPNLLELPLGAVIDAGADTWVYVSRSSDMTRWEKLKVNLVRRTSQFVWVKSDGAGTLKPEDRVLIRGCLELASMQEELATP